MQPNPSDPWYNLDPAQPPAPSSVGPYVPPGGPTPDYDRRYKQAAERVQKKINFYKTLTSYVIVCGFLWLLAILTGSGFWPVFVMLGWGVGLAFQAVDAFGLSVTDQQRQRMIEDEMRRSGPHY